MTSDTGLTNRLRQHSRRGGLAIALVMAATTAICIGGFAVLYAQLQPFISDFVSQEPPDDDAIAFNVGRDDETPTPEPEADEEAAADDDETADEEETEPPTDDGEDQAAEEEPPPEPTEPPPPTPVGFAPDFQSTSEGSVNFRSGPGTRFDPIIALSATTPLRFLGERAVTEDPDADLLSPGQEWMLFEIEDGTQGWIREIDVEPYDPNA